MDGFTLAWQAAPGLLSAVAACSQHGPAGAAPATANPRAAGEDEGPRHRHVPLTNVHIEYRVYGHGDPAVVLVHGWASDANYWSAQLGALKAHYTVVALNLAGPRGFRQQPAATGRLTTTRQDVAAGGKTDPKFAPGARRALHGSCGLAGGSPADRYARDRGDRGRGAALGGGCPRLPPSEIEQRIAPFRADFVAETRKLVTGSLFTPGRESGTGAEGGVRHVT